MKSSLDVAVAEATVVKSTMSTVTSSAKSVLESMDVDPEWQREKMLNEPLELAVTKLKGHGPVRSSIRDFGHQAVEQTLHGRCLLDRELEEI